MDANGHPDMAGGDFPTSPDQLILDSWYLPPEGDQTWRDQDARRIFGEDGKVEISDTGDPPSSPEEEAPEEPTYETPRAISILLPLSLASFAMFFVIAFSVPEILTARFWAAPELHLSPRPAITPMSMADAAPPAPIQRADDSMPRTLRPSFIDDGPIRPIPRPVLMADARASAAIPRAADIRPSAGASAPKADTAQLWHASSGTERQPRHTIHLAGSEAAAEGASPDRLADAKLPAVPNVPNATGSSIGADAPTAMDWKAQAAQWDKLASTIRARSEKYASSPPTVSSPAASANSTDWKAQAAQWDELASAIRARSEKYNKAANIP